MVMVSKVCKNRQHKILQFSPYWHFVKSLVLQYVSKTIIAKQGVMPRRQLVLQLRLLCFIQLRVQGFNSKHWLFICLNLIFGRKRLKSMYMNDIPLCARCDTPLCCELQFKEDLVTSVKWRQQFWITQSTQYQHHTIAGPIQILKLHIIRCRFVHYKIVMGLPLHTPCVSHFKFPCVTDSPIRAVMQFHFTIKSYLFFRHRNTLHHSLDLSNVSLSRRVKC